MLRIETTKLGQVIVTARTDAYEVYVVGLNHIAQDAIYMANCIKI